MRKVKVFCFRQQFQFKPNLSPCCSVFGSLNSDISFFYPWHTKSAVIAGLGPVPPVSGSPDLLNHVHALGSTIIAGLGPGPPAHDFLPFLDPIHSPKYTGSTALADLSPVFCSYALKRFVFDTSVTSYLSVVLVSLCDNLCIIFPSESYCCAQEFLFVNYVTLTNSVSG